VRLRSAVSIIVLRIGVGSVMLTLLGLLADALLRQYLHGSASWVNI
jgi:hypothetical protein